MIGKHITPILLLVACAFGLVSAGCRRPPPIQETWLPMGTFATLTFPRPGPGADLAGDVRAVTALVHRIESCMSLYRPDSDASRLNASAGGDMIPIAPHTRRTLELSKRYAALTHGAFDPTVAPLVHAWGFNDHRVPPTPPAEADLRALRPLVGGGNIVLSNDLAALARQGMKIDFGGIAKGYAVDQAYELLVQRGIENFMVNIGGNLRVRGTSRPQAPWTIGVRDPFDTRRIIGTLKLESGMALATSGNYERFVTIDGRRYAHILDPRTGRPVEGMAGVTVLCPSAAQADALSTGLFVLGVDAAQSVLKAAPDCQALFVPDSTPLRIVVTPGMAPSFTPLPELADHLTLLPN